MKKYGIIEKEVIKFRLDTENKLKLQQIAKQKGITISDLIRQFVILFLKNYED